MDLQRLYERVDLEPPTAYEWAQRTAQLIVDEDVRKLEAQLADDVGAADCVAVAGPADGLALALRVAGVEPEDTVLCTALGCGHVVQGIMQTGATPLFVDINPNTYTVDPYCLDYALGKLKRGEKPTPKALVATDLFGMPCGYDELDALCRREGIALIEDMGDAFGARVGETKAGRLGRFAVASFARCGTVDSGGGAVFCRDEQDAESLRALHKPCGQLIMHPEEYEDKQEPRLDRPQRPAGTRTSPGMEAGIMQARLEDQEEHRRLREKIAQQYERRLRGVVRLQRPTPEARAAYTQLVVALPSAASRDEVLKELHAKGIPCAVPQLVGPHGDGEWNAVMLVSTTAVAGRLVALPMHPFLSGHVVDYICDSLLESLQAKTMTITMTTSAPIP